MGVVLQRYYGQQVCMDSQHWSARPGPQEVSRLRHAVTDYASSHGMQAAAVQDLAIAVSEIVSNAVMHAYPFDRDDGTITVMATAEANEVTIRVVDDGIGLRPR